MNAFENSDLYFYSLIPTGIAIIVALCIIAALLWCYCKKGRQNEDPVPKVTEDVESRGAEPNPGTCSGSQKSNRLESGETVKMLYPDVPNPGTPKITSSSKIYIRGASQTEQLLKNTDVRSPDSSFPTQEPGQFFESATSASRGPITQLAPPNSQLESGQWGFSRRNTTGEIIKTSLYPLIPIPRTRTLPSPKPQPFDESNDLPHCVSPYSQSQEKITTNSPLLDHSMCPSQRPTVVKIGDNFKFTEKQTLEDLRHSEIIVTNSIESRNDLNLEESLRKVRQDTENINNLGSQEMQIGERNEGSNLSDKSSMPSEVEISSSHKSYPNHETEKTFVRRKLPSDSMNDQDSDKSICIPIVSDEVRDRYQDGPRYILTPSLDSVSVGSSNTTDLMTKNSLPSLTHSSIIEDSPSNIQHIPDIVAASPQKPDVIPGLTLDGPPNRIDLIVNPITGTIHEKTENMANSSTEERSDHSLAPDDTHVESKMTEPHVDNGVTHFENSDSSVSFPGQSSVQTGSNIGEIDVTERLSIDQRHIYKSENDTLVPDCTPSPTHTAEYQTANNSETDYQSIDTSSQKMDDLSVTTNGNEEVDTMSPLSLLEPPTFLYDPKNTADYQLLQEAIHTDKQQTQEQQQLLSSYPDSLLISSIGNTPEQTPLQTSDSFVTLPEHNTDLDIDLTNIGCNPELPQAFSPSTSLPAQMDHDTIIIESNCLSIHSQNNTISTTQVPFDEVQNQPQGNDAVPLNEDSIVPQNISKNEGDFVTDRYENNTTPIPSEVLLDTTQTHLHQRSVDSPITFSDYIAREWIGTSDNAKRVRNGYHELEMMDYTHLMSIRGDNYCAVRSTLFQTFCVRDFNVCSFLANMKPPIEARQIVAPMMEKYPFLSKWSFANKPSFQKLGETKDVLEMCIDNLAFEVDHVRGWEPINRMIYIYSKLNTQKEIFDFSLMEALKFYMFIELAKYWEIYSQGGEVPESMFFLFIREDSMNLEDFLVNHLNHVGDSGGLEMVEMFLLGFTLDLQIKVARISSFGKEDFLTYYPQGEYPPERIISISAEDDRHYNALATLGSTDDFYLPADKIPKSN
ncbi:hypothetical protein LOD99_9707 [Oopsacas minuta]|uniref:Ubiquitinyl hydrolase 1 n=1 Tax=Oopsacas minuta TaxID=111878 RepID=A0AAV7KSQ6_9METZ|nr:hypothetical protein LOD99_9707 [Oopsacas minuta]